MSFLTDKINKSKNKDILHIEPKGESPLMNLASNKKDESQTIQLDKQNTSDTKETPQTSINKQSDVPKPKPFKLGIGVAKTKPVSTDEKQPDTVQPKINNPSPFAGLKNAIANNDTVSKMAIKNILGNISTKTSQTPQTNNAETSKDSPVQTQTLQSGTPTLGDLSKFVFEEQPEESTEEIAMRFSGMLDNLSTAMGTDIPKVLSETLIFMKTNPFLATLLKPEEIGSLVKTMARSYGFVANNQTQKSEKKKAKTQEVNQILNSLDGLSF